MKLNQPPKRPAQDPTIALINVVFLMLIFFLLAGTIAARGPADIALIRTSEAARARPPAKPVALTAAGAIVYGGATLDQATLFARLAQTKAAAQPAAGGLDADPASAGGEPVQILADRKLAASELIAFLRAMKDHGFSARIVTRSGGNL